MKRIVSLIQKPITGNRETYLILNGRLLLLRLLLLLGRHGDEFFFPVLLLLNQRQMRLVSEAGRYPSQCGESKVRPDKIKRTRK